jgi:hypothetical protein
MGGSPDLSGGKKFYHRLDKVHTLLTIEVSLFLEQPPQYGNGNPT